MKKRISRYIIALVSLVGTFQLAYAQQDDSEVVRGVQYRSSEQLAHHKEREPLLSGCSVSGDVVGLTMLAFAPYGQIEGAFCLNLRNSFFPVFELGWGISNHTSEETELHYKTNAPYFRIGCDYNLLKNKQTGNRLFGGLRYAFTSFNYDLDGPDLVDPVWNTVTPFRYTGLDGSCQWAEVVFGLEANIWKFFHLGWSVRYKMRMHQKTSPLGQSWYVPGFGKNGSNTLGGTFQVIFDI